MFDSVVILTLDRSVFHVNSPGLHNEANENRNVVAGLAPARFL